MRRRVLLAVLAATLAALAAADAKAQTPTPDDFARTSYGPAFDRSEADSGPRHIPAQFREEASPIEIADSGFSVPFGPVRLVGHGTSFSPSGNQKLRNERLHFAWRVDEDTDFLVGAWRFKHRQEGLPRFRDLTIGMGMSWRY